MKTNRRGWPGPIWRSLTIAALAGVAGRHTIAAETNATTSAATEKAKAEPTAEETPTDYRNWVEVTVGSTFIRGDKASYMRRHGLRDGPFGGVEDFHFEQDVGKRALFQVDGRGIFDNHDYSLRLELAHPEKGFVRAGYREFRTWYDGSGGFFPRNEQWFSIYNEELALDRGEAWVEGGLTVPGWPELRVKYSHEFRDGRKDSTSWGDTSLTGLPGPNNVRGIVPSFLDINEQRNIIEADVKHTLGNTDLGAGLTFEFSDNNNSRNIRRRPGEASDRHLTQREGVDTDLFNVHAFTETRLHKKVLFTTGYSFTTLDTDVSGSRIYGADYDAVYDPVFARRQQRDEGFLNLSGGSQLDQHVLNMNLMLTPWTHVTIVPSIRVERQDQEGSASFIETDVGPGPGFVSTQTPLQNTRERGFTDVSESLEVRYTGLTNWAFYARGEWLEGEGDLKERETEAQTGLVSRDTDSTRFTQKYSVGANWYPRRGLNLASQYYYKSRQNDYDHTLDSTLNTGGDRYPAFLRDQDFATHDVNFRVTWRPLAKVTLVTRYDFQFSTIDTRADLLSEIQSAESTAHIISESISWTPFSRLFLQGSINYVWDQTDTPAANAIPGTNVVLNGKNNYWNASALAGIVMSQRTDLQLQYLYYRANNYQNNSAFSQPYGAEAEEHGVTATLIQRLTKQLRWTLRYGFFNNRDITSGGRNNYEAHLVQSSLQYRF